MQHINKSVPKLQRDFIFEHFTDSNAGVFCLLPMNNNKKEERRGETAEKIIIPTVPIPVKYKRNRDKNRSEKDEYRQLVHSLFFCINRQSATASYSRRTPRSS